MIAEDSLDGFSLTYRIKPVLSGSDGKLCFRFIRAPHTLSRQIVLDQMVM